VEGRPARRRPAGTVLDLTGGHGGNIKPSDRLEKEA
jgi:hypothetical protein